METGPALSGEPSAALAPIGRPEMQPATDDFVGSFQFWGDAQNFQRQLRERFAQFNLELAEEKTRLLLFGRFAASRRLALRDVSRLNIPMPDTQIDFSAPATLRKWPSVNNEPVSASLGARP